MGGSIVIVLIALAVGGLVGALIGETVNRTTGGF